MKNFSDRIKKIASEILGLEVEPKIESEVIKKGPGRFLTYEDILPPEYVASREFKMKRFIEALNYDLLLEYSAAIQYIQHASVISGPGFESFIEHLLEHADDEIKHAKMLSDKIDYLGGIPTMSVGPTDTSEFAESILQIDLASEQQAIDRYKKRIEEAEALGEYGVKHMLEQILLDEEEHKNDLLTILNKKE